MGARVVDSSGYIHGMNIDNPPHRASPDLAAAWRDAQTHLPDGIELGGVVYHGPERVPGTEWVAFACDATGGTVGPEGAASDPMEALDDLVRVMTSRGS
jgi:hypothetical protein